MKRKKLLYIVANSKPELLSTCQRGAKLFIQCFLEKNPETREFEIKELRYGGYLTIMDIEGMGWRSITQDQYDEFTITSEDEKILKKYAFF